MFCSSCGSDVLEGANFCQKCGTRAGAADPAAVPANSSAQGTQAWPITSSADNDQLLVIVAHLGGIFFGFIPSLIVFLIKKDAPGWVLDNAREALNWQITVLIAGMVCGLLMLVLIGIVLFWALMLANLVLCILATVKASNKQTYRYPFCLRLLK